MARSARFPYVSAQRATSPHGYAAPIPPKSLKKGRHQGEHDPPTLGSATLRKAVHADDGFWVQAGAEVVVLEQVGDEYIIEVLADGARSIAEVPADVLEWTQ